MILAGDVLADRLGVSGIEPRARRRRCGYVKWASRRPSTECSKASVERSVCAATAEVGHLYRTVELAILASDAKCFEKGIQDSFQPPPPAGADASAAHVDRVAMNQPPRRGAGGSRQNAPTSAGAALLLPTTVRRLSPSPALGCHRSTPP